MLSKTQSEASAKTECRLELRRHLGSIIGGSPADMSARHERVAGRLRDVLKGRPGLWLAYAAADDEPNVELAIPGVQFAYPLIDIELRTMEFYVSSSEAPSWVENRFKLREPDPLDPTWTLVNRSDLVKGTVRGVLIPGLGFDRRLNRLGRGAGFYDRYLEGIQIFKIGVAFAEQLVDELPVEPHDIGVDAVITDRDVLWKVSTAQAV